MSKRPNICLTNERKIEILKTIEAFKEIASREKEIASRKKKINGIISDAYYFFVVN